MRVLHVLEAVEGGTARHLSYVVRYVSADHHLVVPPERIGGLTDTTAFDAMESAGATLHFMPMRRSPIDWRNTVAIPRIRRIIQRMHPGVVHGHSSIGGALARVAAMGTGTKRIYTPHGLLPSRTAMALERALGPTTDVVVASSPSEAERIARLKLVPAHKVVVIPNAVELEKPPPAPLDVRVKLGVRRDTLVVGTVGRLVPVKAPEVFVRACALVARRKPQACFVLVGYGPLAPLVEREIEAAGIGDRFLLLQDSHDGPSLMEQLDVFALPSRYEAGASFAAMEAMRARTPVVVTNVVGNRDTVEHGTSGFVVPCDDAAALAEVLVRLLDDAGLRRRIAEAAEQRLRDRFDVRMAGERLAALYKSVSVTRRPSLVHKPSHLDNWLKDRDS